MLELPNMRDLVEMPSRREINFVRRIGELPDMLRLDKRGMLKGIDKAEFAFNRFMHETKILHQLIVDSPDWVTNDAKDWYSSVTCQDDIFEFSSVEDGDFGSLPKKNLPRGGLPSKREFCTCCNPPKFL